MEKISFVDKLIAFIKGDDATVKASKIQRKAKSQLKIAISNLDNEIIKAEEALDNATENLQVAKLNNGSDIFNDDMGYTNEIVRAYNAKVVAEETLDNLKRQLEFFKEVYAEVSGE